MGIRGLIASVLLAGMVFVPASGIHAQEAVDTEPIASPKTAIEPVEVIENPAPIQELEHVLTDTADVTAPAITRAKAFYNPNGSERSAGSRTEIESGLTDFHIIVSDEMNEEPKVRVDFSPIGGERSVSPSENVSSVFSKHMFYQGPPVTVPDGTYELPYTVSDPHGNTVTGSIAVTIDETAPTIDAFSVSLEEDRVILTGSVTETTTPDALSLSLVTVNQYRENGEPTSMPTYVMGWMTPRTLGPGSFVFEFPPERALLDGGFAEDARTFDVTFSVSDGAGNVAATTSPRIVISTTTEPIPATASNVLFLPGIKGSRLYRPTDSCDPDLSLSCLGVKLWEPSGDKLLEDLFLDENGESGRDDIYVREGDIITEVFGQNFYASFVNQMNALKADGAIIDWKPVAYDWRLSLNDIVSKGVKRDGKIYFQKETDTPYIEETLLELASTSPTHKVTIIAHSNGGLVTKRLMQRLEDEGHTELVDKIIFVGVPQSGAPQAMTGLLYGYREALPSDKCGEWPVLGKLCSLLASRGTARALAEHSPMAYHLLPSQAYFDRSLGGEYPVGKFNAASEYALERNAYGDTLDTADELYDFLSAQEEGRSKPSADDVTSANVLSSNLLEYGKDVHELIDSWTPPAGVQVHQIAGWGLETIAGVEFYEQRKLLGGYKKMYRPIFTQKGDKVVPEISAEHMNQSDFVKKYWIDLKTAALDGSSEHSHGDMLESEELRTLLRDIVLDLESKTINYISLSEPALQSAESRFIFYLHSPLTLELRDAIGNHVGYTENGDLESNIPNAEYGEFGDVKYIIAPKDKYELLLNGESSGEFTLDMQEISTSEVISSITLADIPTTEHTQARIFIDGDLASTTSFTVDENGDDVIDFEIMPKKGATLYAPEVETSSKQTVSSNESSRHSRVNGNTLQQEEKSVRDFGFKHGNVQSIRPKILSVKSPMLTSNDLLEQLDEEPAELEGTLTASVYDAVSEGLFRWVQALVYNFLEALQKILRMIFPLKP